MTLAVSFLSRLAGGDDGESYFAGGGAGNGVDAGQLLSGGKPSDAAGGSGPAGAGGDGQTVWCGCLSLVFYQQVRGCGAFCLFVFLSFCGVYVVPGGCLVSDTFCVSVYASSAAAAFAAPLSLPTTNNAGAVFQGGH